MKIEQTETEPVAKPTPEVDHPWKKWFGTLKRDRVTEEWLQEVANYRAEIDRRDAENA